MLNPERVYCEANPFRVENNIGNDKPRVALRSNPGLQLANAFGVILISRLYFYDHFVSVSVMYSEPHAYLVAV